MKKKLVAVLLCGMLALSLAVPALAATSTLSDISGHWAEKELTQAVDAGWVNGYPDGTFRPDDTITRAEFVKMLLAATHLTPESETVQWMKQNAVVDNPYRQGLTPYQPALNDVAHHWLTTQGWTDAALYSGIVVPDDYTGHQFSPNLPITRYQIAVMADRAMGLVYPASQPLTEELTFSDREQIPQWVRGYIKEAAKAGVLEGYPDGSFGYNKTATRAEAVAMVQRVLTYMEEGINPKIKTVVVYDNDTAVKPEMETNSMRLQRINGCLYASMRDIYSAQEALMEGKTTFDPTIMASEDHPSLWIGWDPIYQQLEVLNKWEESTNTITITTETPEGRMS